MANDKVSNRRGRCNGRNAPGTPSIARLKRAAIARGDTRFDPLIPCTYGHMSLRWTSGGNCIECARIAAKAPGDAVIGGRSHNRTAPGTPTITERWQAAKARGEQTFDPGVSCVKGHACHRWANNGICIECKRARDNAYNAAHAEEHRARSKRSALARHDEVKAYYRQWARENPEKVRATIAKRAALKIGAEVGDRAAYARFVKWARSAPRVRCYWCKAITRPGGRQLDHIIPLSKGGPDSAGNLCVACTPCNRHKSAKLPEDFAGQSEMRFA